MTLAKTSTSLATVRPATPRPSSSFLMQLDAAFDKELRKKPQNSEKPDKLKKKKLWHRATELPEEAEALKQLIRRKWPESAFKFKFRLMKRIVVPPVQIPAEFAHARAWAAMVSGIRIPLTRTMWRRQRNRFLGRILDTICE